MAVTEPSKVRNVGLLGHSGVGKTTLIELILNRTGVTGRLGKIEEGNTVSDYLEEEIEHQHTICMKLTHFTWNDKRIHVVDHPGYADFLGEVAASTPLMDGVVIVVDATTGVQVGTDFAWKYAELHNVPRAFFINKLDRENTDFKKIVTGIQDVYGKHCVPLTVPIGESESLSGIAHVLTGEEEIAQAYNEVLMDAVAETDDVLMEKYLESRELSEEEFHKGLHDGLAAGQIIPIFVGSAVKDIGIDSLLDAVAEDFPSPLDRKVVATNGSSEEVQVKIGADEPFIGQVFRSMVDPFVGHLTLFRVLTGTLKADSEFYNVSTNSKERTGKLFLLNGKMQEQVKQVVPGDLAAMTKLKKTHFGDTIAAMGTKIGLPRIELPESMVKLAISPKSRSDEDKIGEALHHLAEEDPTFTHYRDNDTGEHVIRGMGEMQLEILLARMKRKYNVEAVTSTPMVAYRETIRGKSDVQGKHKKQSGGHGQYGDVKIKLSPNARDAGYKFVDSIVGGVVPKQYIPHVDKGCHDALLKGVISGHPVVDIVVDLYYGSYHNVDSSEMAFKVAASIAIRKGIREAHPFILEPIMEIAITIPEAFMGDVNGDLNSRRGRILGMDPLGGGRQCIRANVPESEVLRYSTDLRSISSGHGTYEMKFSHYDEVPAHVGKALIEAYEKSRSEEN